MEKLRKIAERIWLNKERMVFAAMVVVLSYYVYKALNPDPLEELPPSPSVRPEVDPNLLDDKITIPAPPPLRTPGDWDIVHERNPFWYFATASASRGQDSANQDPGVHLISIKMVGDKYRAQLRTRATKWYDEGESFESFELLKINPDEGTVEVYSEQLGRTVILRLP